MTTAIRPRRRPLGPANRRLLAEALPALALASLAVRLAPFRRVAAWASGGRGGVELDDAMLRKARWAVEAWARRVPWRTVCFQKGLALHWMLRRRGVASVLHYGVAQEAATGLRAHVWVCVAGRPVIGGEEAEGFACLATFPPQEPPASAPRGAKTLPQTDFS